MHKLRLRGKSQSSTKSKDKSSSSKRAEVLDIRHNVPSFTRQQQPVLRLNDIDDGGNDSFRTSLILVRDGYTIP